MSALRRNARGIVATLLISFALVLGIFVGRVSAQPNQPNMQAALQALYQARDSLWAASPNKGGHRERALNLVNQAIWETQQGINFAE